MAVEAKRGKLMAADSEQGKIMTGEADWGKFMEGEANRGKFMVAEVDQGKLMAVDALAMLLTMTRIHPPPPTRTPVSQILLATLPSILAATLILRTTIHTTKNGIDHLSDVIRR